MGFPIRRYEGMSVSPTTGGFHRVNWQKAPRAPVVCVFPPFFPADESAGQRSTSDMVLHNGQRLVDSDEAD